MQPERAPAWPEAEGGGLAHPQLSHSKTHDGGELCGDQNISVSVRVHSGECPPLQLSHLAPILRRQPCPHPQGRHGEPPCKVTHAYEVEATKKDYVAV